MNDLSTWRWRMNIFIFGVCVIASYHRRVLPSAVAVEGCGSSAACSALLASPTASPGKTEASACVSGRRVYSSRTSSGRSGPSPPLLVGPRFRCASNVSMSRATANPACAFGFSGSKRVYNKTKERALRPVIEPLSRCNAESNASSLCTANNSSCCKFAGTGGGVSTRGLVAGRLCAAAPAERRIALLALPMIRQTLVTIGSGVRWRPNRSDDDVMAGVRGFCCAAAVDMSAAIAPHVRVISRGRRKPHVARQHGRFASFSFCPQPAWTATSSCA